MILSDLDVHREQAGGTARYFGIDDPGTLADHLADLSQAAGPGAVRNLLPNLEGRVAAFAADFARVFQNAARSSPR
jgi:hypothetical protein